jgi:hypothetical protein
MTRLAVTILGCLSVLTLTAANRVTAGEASRTETSKTETGKTFDQRWPEQTPGQVRPAPKATARAKSASAPQPSLPVSLDQSLYLIRSALLTLNDANRSGNYTVLRDLAAPDFRARNSAADLAAIFANLRARKFDLFAVALVAPRLSSPPALDTKRMLRLTGSFPTRPRRIAFNLTFQNVGGQWQLYDIAIATPPAVVATSAAAGAQAKKN